MNSYVDKCTELINKMSEILDLDINYVTKEDMVQLRRCSAKLSILCMQVQLDMEKWRQDWNLEYWDTFDTLADKMNKSVTFSDKAAKYQADKRYWEFRTLDGVLSSVDRILRQVWDFAVQVNVLWKNEFIS